MGWVFTPGTGGGVRLELGPNERDILRSLPAQLAEVLRDSPGEVALTRLSPPAYVEEPEHEAEYRRYMGDDLRERQLTALSLMEESAGAAELTAEQSEGWLSALNSLRLVLGTQLDVGEDIDDELGALDDDENPPHPDDPRGPALALYRFLSALLEELVEAMSESLPEVEEEP